MFHVDSEVGRLRQVVLHRPDLELKRLTPDNAADLLFDDVLWVSRAQAEHDAFADALRSRGVVVHYYGDLRRTRAARRASAVTRRKRRLPSGLPVRSPHASLRMRGCG